MAVIPFGDATPVSDTAAQDAPLTLGDTSNDCYPDTRAVTERGATPLEAPADRPWGVRVAYVQGPSGLTFGIEQPLRQNA